VTYGIRYFRRRRADCLDFPPVTVERRSLLSSKSSSESLRSVRLCRSIRFARSRIVRRSFVFILSASRALKLPPFRLDWRGNAARFSRVRRERWAFAARTRRPRSKAHAGRMSRRRWGFVCRSAARRFPAGQRSRPIQATRDRAPRGPEDHSRTTEAHPTRCWRRQRRNLRASGRGERGCGGHRRLRRSERASQSQARGCRLPEFSL
jgi:hypothetical protein